MILGIERKNIVIPNQNLIVITKLLNEHGFKGEGLFDPLGAHSLLEKNIIISG